METYWYQAEEAAQEQYPPEEVLPQEEQQEMANEGSAPPKERKKWARACKCKGDGPFVLGDTFSFAECATAPFAQRLAAVLPGMRPSLDVSKYMATEKLSHVSRWMTAVCERPSCVETLPPKEELQESYERLMERMKAMAAGGGGPPGR